ncbi:MAG: ATP-binding protein [Dehalococcoidia bacterium]
MSKGSNGGDNDLWSRVWKAAREMDVRGVVDRVGEQLGKAITGTSDGPGVQRASAVPAATFRDVGGLTEAKRELESVCVALSRPEVYQRWGTRPPKGVLLYGPPGTGKTLLARCVAGQAEAAFFHIRAVDVASMWYGQAERRLQDAFDRARKQTPAVVFLDEVDALTPPRETSHEASHRVVSTLLENLDGLRPLEGVVVLAATNTPQSVDPALLRPGRLDRLVEVPLPEAEARLQILYVHMRRAERRAGRRLFESSDWRRLVRATEGMSGAEIEETVRRALEARVRLHDDADIQRLITEEELLDAAGAFEWNKPGRAQRRQRWWGT